ncbi:DUF808 domain-containing protein [Aliikangiella marina]|uniref:DUF808 domain-containing protein n=1 Tax=Aliikangiella marina TaxID=1712262 RepID=A0A545T730_9GAMM|nr:DUF808 domain-containing protein [Aliikangiella marina]TQV72982.1 DUF808 domain-containing protein [Aliikangiella marina]
MAGSSLLALLDDIATLLDDVSVMTKVAAKKTSGVLGDDLALNAEQVAGVRADRELPVVWAVAKGSFKNKFILVPAALAISAFVPVLILPLLMIGGAFLCFEGFEKVAHKLLHSKEEDQQKHQAIIKAVADPKVDMVEFEQNKIKGAIRTDFILSAEIIVIALGTVQDKAFEMQAAVVSILALLITVVVYGLVAGIVKLDDAGFYLIKAQGEALLARLKRAFGRGLLSFAPFLMKSLSVVGTAAMFLVGGGILLHGIPVLEPFVHGFQQVVAGWPYIGGTLAFLSDSIIGALVGIAAGAILVVIMTQVQKLTKKTASA